ncbi:Maf family protein [Candidatus Poribacteria bacterium]
MKLILASASPRRRQLMEQIGLTFEVMPSNVDEDDIVGHDPLMNIQAIALHKARAVAARLEDGIVIGADTQILMDGEILGKPSDEADAARMLLKLSGRTHRAITGVALVDASTHVEETWVETTLVTFRELLESEISAYVDTGEPMGKAGAYGIQGRAAAFVEKIEGCYFNVVGLPLAKLVQNLKKWSGRKK